MKGRKLLGPLAAVFLAVAFILMIDSSLARKEEWTAIEKHLSTSRIVSERMGSVEPWQRKSTPQKVFFQPDGALGGELHYAGNKKTLSVKWSRKSKDSPILRLSIYDITGNKKPKLLEEVDVPVQTSSIK